MKRKEMKKMGVKKIGLFGSFVKGKQKKNSDVDVLVEFKNISADNFFGLLFLLEKLFKRKIDLIEINSLRKELNYIKEEAQYVKI